MVRYVDVRQKRAVLPFTNSLSSVNILDVRMAGLLTICSPHQTQRSVFSASVLFAHVQNVRADSQPGSTLRQKQELTEENCPERTDTPVLQIITGTFRKTFQFEYSTSIMLICLSPNVATRVYSHSDSSLML